MSPAVLRKRGSLRACSSCGAQSRHHLVDKEINGMQAFSQAQVAEGKLRLQQHISRLRTGSLTEETLAAMEEALNLF